MTLRDLEKDEVITVARDPEGKVLSAGLHDTERANGRENFDFYCFLIWPFIESTWLGAVALMGLTPPMGSKNDTWIDGVKAQNSAQLLGKTLYHQGDLSYFEAVNKETLKNAFQLFEEEGITVLSKSRDKKVPATIKLSDEWTPSRDENTGMILPHGRLWSFVEMIAQSRIEGKNRRDAPTVSTRVLVLADKLGRQLFETAAALGDSAANDLRTPKRRRHKEIHTKAKL